MHTCDNRKCVNPDHLKLGSIADNIKDAAAKNRIQHGETHSNATLTNRQCDEIRASTEVQSVVAKRYGISQSHVSNIRQGKRRSKDHLSTPL